MPCITELNVLRMSPHLQIASFFVTFMNTIYKNETEAASYPGNNVYCFPAGFSSP